MMEVPEGDPLPLSHDSATGDTVKVPGDIVRTQIKPYEILTIRVDYPDAGPKS